MKKEEMERAFIELLNGDAPTLDAYEENVSRAMAFLAAELPISGVKVCLHAPVSRIYPQGKKHEAVLYGTASEIEKNTCHKEYHLPDGGEVVFEIGIFEGQNLTEEQKEQVHYLFRETYVHYSRFMMSHMIYQVMNTDLSTGVLTPEAFMTFVGQKLAEKTLDQYQIVFFNIHNFKYVNKVFSYEQGDIVLRNYAQKVNSSLQSDEKMARLGGDNFLLLIKNEHAKEVLGNLRNIRMVYQTPQKTKELVFGATVGISSLKDIQVPRDIMARASIAYQAARRKGAGKAARYTEEVRMQMMHTQSIISNFPMALKAREFVVYYQPKVDISQKKCCGAEALVRWIQNGNVIAPGKFVPQLEQEGSICQLDYYVLEEVCKFQKKRQENGEKMVCISVNFSRKHLQEKNLVKNILRIIDHYEVEHQYLEIELTESEDFQDYERMAEIVGELAENGIVTSIDDFGTGFSSLNMIKRVDIDVIKIDRSFIPLETEYQGKKKDMIMFCSIVELVKNLGKKIVAEGVETVEQLQYLTQAGCEIVQGYVFDKPLPQADFEERLCR